MQRYAEQLRQVGITYITHRWVVLITLGVVVFMVPNLIIVMTDQPAASRAQALLFLIGCPALSGMMFLVMHAKAQFAHCRARLMPGFSRPHLTVLGGVLVGLVLVYPLLLARAGRFDPLGLVALSLAIAAPYAWGAHTSRGPWMLVSMVVFFSMMAEWGVRWWVVDASAHWPIHALIIACGVVLLSAWLWRMGRLREEMDDYQTTVSWGSSRKAGAEVPEQRRLVAARMDRHRLLSWVGDTWLTGIGGYHGHRRLRLARLLRYGFGSIPTELHGLFILLMLAAMAVLFTHLSHDSGRLGLGGLLLPVQFAILMPGMSVGQLLARRRPRLASELLCPLSRREWVDSLLVASAWNSVVWWLIMNVGLVLVAWPILGDRLTPAIVAMFLLLSVTIALVLFGIALRTAFWNSLAMRFILVAFAFVILMASVAVWYGLRNQYGDGPFVVMALVLAAVGAGLVVNARRAWLRLELG